jgi:hypothetical protein
MGRLASTKRAPPNRQEGTARSAQSLYGFTGLAVSRRHRRIVFCPWQGLFR